MAELALVVLAQEPAALELVPVRAAPVLLPVAPVLAVVQVLPVLAEPVRVAAQRIAPQRGVQDRVGELAHARRFISSKTAASRAKQTTPTNVSDPADIPGYECFGRCCLVDPARANFYPA